MPRCHIPGGAAPLANLRLVPTLVLLRHGESTWNRENRFTGWVDVDLTPRGEDEARGAGRLLAREGVAFDVVHTSLQKRAIRTANLALDVTERLWVPVRRSWRLNERHYGALQGLDKKETAERYGPEQVFAWRRGYATPPPPDTEDRFHLRHDPRYRHLPPEVVPASECLADVVERMLPWWHDAIAADLLSGLTVLVVAHGNSLRALVKHLDGISDDEIADVNIPTGRPLRYELASDLKVLDQGYLGDEAEARAAAEAVARQAGAAAAAQGGEVAAKGADAESASGGKERLEAPAGGHPDDVREGPGPGAAG